MSPYAEYSYAEQHVVNISVSELLKNDNNLNETHQTAAGLMEGCSSKLHRYNDNEICGMLPVSETTETSVMSICLSVTGLNLDSDRSYKKLLYMESEACSAEQMLALLRMRSLLNYI
jgi:hypothetical protein